MSKGYVNHCCCPSQSPTAVSSWHSPVELPFSCVWLVLLLFPPVGWVLHSLSISWASHIRRTSGVRHQEWSLRGTTHLPPPAPTPLCLSLFIFQPFSSSLPKAFFFLRIPSSLSPSSSPPPAPSTTPQTPGQVWASQIPSVWRGYATSVGAFSARVVGQAQPTSPSMHHSEHATNEHDWRNVPVPVPCLFVW